MAWPATEPSPLAGISTWIFDLDNTLYPRTCNLWSQIDKRITSYVMEVTGLEWTPARAMQKGFFRDHGTTLNGLMSTYGIDPEHYLADVHRIDYSPVAADPGLVAAIGALPGRKLVFTSADAGHAGAVLTRLGGEDLFEAVFDIRAAGFTSKPGRSAYERLVEMHGVVPRQSVMFDDLERNLKVAHEIGMRTVHVVPPEAFADAAVENWEVARADEAAHVDYVTDDLKRFLSPLG